MIRKALRALAWMVGSVSLLGVVAWAVLLAINWRDRAPSATALRLENTFRERPAVADEHNAFIYVLGFSVGPTESPREMGMKRLAWMQHVPVDARKDPLGRHAEARYARDPTIRAFIEACGPDRPRCNEAFSTASEVFDRWIASEPWLLERYRTLIAHPQWQETVPFDVSAPLPAYAQVMDGQRLLLLNAGVLAQKDDVAGVRDLLSSDLRFWREVLKSSDILITKMIATVALNRHFEMGNLVLRELPPQRAALAMPPEWVVPLSESERSLNRVMIGEWMFSAALSRQEQVIQFWTSPDELFEEGPSARAKVLTWLFEPLYRPQDSINAYAAHYAEVASVLDAPLRNYDAALEQASAINERWQREAQNSRSPYNIVGNRIRAVGATDFGSYARRVNDLEGGRLAALAAVTLREKKVQPRDVAAALEALPFRNPYNDRPLAWDTGTGSIVFVGLEPGARGEHRIKY